MRDATYYPALRGDVVRPERLAEYAATKLATVPLDLKAKTGRESVQVKANHGRWVVECECGGALFAHPSDPRFLCVDCGNSTTGGKYRPVVWPKNYAEITSLLDARPDPTTRNWSPGETLADLRRENKVLLP